MLPACVPEHAYSWALLCYVVVLHSFHGMFFSRFVGHAGYNIGKKEKGDSLRHPFEHRSLRLSQEWRYDSGIKLVGLHAGRRRERGVSMLHGGANKKI